MAIIAHTLRSTHHRLSSFELHKPGPAQVETCSTSRARRYNQHTVELVTADFLNNHCHTEKNEYISI